MTSRSARSSTRSPALGCKRNRGLFAALVALGLLWHPATLRAQIVRGRVLSLVDSASAPGVLVQLLGADGAVVVQQISDQRGAFTLRAQGQGTFRLRALRIGFRPSTGDAFFVAASGITERSLVLTSAAVNLAATSVRATKRCDAGNDTTSLGFRAWEQARTALAASLATRESSRYGIELVVFNLTRDSLGDSVVRYDEHLSRTDNGRPFTAVPHGWLRDSGYVVHDAAGIHVAAPDEEVLLSEFFAVTHCLRAREASGDSIVLVFEPTRDRALSDVAGELILSRETSELRSMRFEYVNVPPQERDAHPGGSLTFVRLSTGGWIVSRWRIRFPVLEGSRVADSRGVMLNVYNQRDIKYRVASWQEDGGEALRVEQDGQLLWRAPTATIHGRVIDDSLGLPLAGTAVRLGSSRVTAGEDGSFTLSDARLGDVQIEATPPYAGSIGIGPRRLHAETRADDRVLVLRLPHPVRAVVQACDAVGLALPPDVERSIVHGIVRDAYGGRGGSSDVSITWEAQKPDASGSHREIRTKSSATGNYVACGMPIGVPLQLRALVGGTTIAEAFTIVPVGERGVAVDLHSTTPR